MDANDAGSPAPSVPTRVFDELRVHSRTGVRREFRPQHRGPESAPLLLVHARDCGVIERCALRIPVPAGSLCFLSNDATVTFTGHEDGSIVFVELPRQVALRSRERISSATGLVIASDAGAPALLRSFLDTLDEQPAYCPDHPGWVQTCLCEMVERVLTECATTGLSQSERAMAAAKTYIRSHLADTDLAPEQVALEAAVSPRTLNRLFAAEGDSVGGWIRRQRLERCRADFEDPGKAGRSIGQVAAMWGFLDPAHFSRVFKDAFGASPRAYRLQHQLVPAPRVPGVHRVA